MPFEAIRWPILVSYVVCKCRVQAQTLNSYLLYLVLAPAPLLNSYGAGASTTYCTYEFNACQEDVPALKSTHNRAEAMEHGMWNRSLPLADSREVRLVGHCE